MSDTNTRKTKHFSDEEEKIELEELTRPTFRPRTTEEERRVIAEVAQATHFSSREPIKRKQRKRSPYVIQKNLKMRLGMSELLGELTEKVNSGSDQETFELAIEALIEKHKLENLISKYNRLITDS